MSTPHGDPDPARALVRSTSSSPVVLVVLVVVGAARLQLRAGRPQQAEDKADQLIAALEDAGAPAPPTRTRSCGCSATTAARPAPTRTRR